MCQSGFHSKGAAVTPWFEFGESQGQCGTSGNSYRLTTNTIPSVIMGAGEKFAPNLSSSFQEKEKLTKDIVNHPSILFYYYYYFPDSENSTNGQWQCFQTKVTIMWKINCWEITLQCWNQMSWLGFRKKIKQKKWWAIQNNSCLTPEHIKYWK